jgi:hypothetical protein
LGRPLWKLLLSQSQRKEHHERKYADNGVSDVALSGWGTWLLGLGADWLLGWAPRALQEWWWQRREKYPLERLLVSELPEKSSIPRCLVRGISVYIVDDIFKRNLFNEETRSDAGSNDNFLFAFGRLTEIDNYLRELARIPTLFVRELTRVINLY